MNPRAMLLAAWKTNNQVNAFLVRQIPPSLWATAAPGLPRRTVRDIAAHLHNARRRWIRTLGPTHHHVVIRRTSSLGAALACPSRSLFR